MCYLLSHLRMVAIPTLTNTHDASFRSISTTVQLQVMSESALTLCWCSFWADSGTSNAVSNSHADCNTQDEVA